MSSPTPRPLATSIANGVTESSPVQPQIMRSRLDLLTLPDGTLLDDVDRRHIISSDEMAKHCQARLRPLRVSEDAPLLTGKGSPVRPPPTKEKVVAAAQKLHREFFNQLDNLWPGASSPNRALGARRDPPGPGEPFVAPMPPGDLQSHEQVIYSKFGLD